MKTIGILDSTRSMGWRPYYEKGINSRNYNSQQINTWKHIDKIKDLYALMFCGYFYDRWFNYNVLQECLKYNVPIIYTDSGIIDARETVTITIDKTKNKGIDYAKIAHYNNPDNKKQMEKAFNKIRLEKWQSNKDSNTVLLLTHNFNGYSSLTKSINTQHKECQSVTEKLSSLEYKIFISNHPKHGKSPGLFTKIDRKWNLQRIDKGIIKSKFAVGWHTNALCYAVFKGLPIVCFDEECFAYPMASHSLEEPLIYPDRQEWMSILSWTQWTNAELAMGSFWDVVTNYIDTNNPKEKR